MKKKLLKQAILGTLVGLAVFAIYVNIIKLTYNQEDLVNVMMQVVSIKVTIGHIIIGLGFFLPRVFFKYTNLKIATILHFIIGVGSLIIVNLFLGLANMMEILSIFIIAFIIYLIIWIAMYLYYRNLYKKINLKIKENQI